ncbi:6-bladed beta-propeller [Pedobacter borealis]|uniref:6-bladed beta-propeller n=1 Tax=Pedobacter borealis TaxID=475254 RepID=UPI000493108C|nr:6-bladed beta-propeller [Pedobacter borealis]
MKLTRITSGLLLILVIASCKQKPKSSLKKNINEIKTNTVVNGTTFVDSKNLYDSVVYVPLQTTQHNLIAKIDQLEVTDKYFIILDHDSKSISIYLKNGKFFKKIDSVNASEFWVYDDVISFRDLSSHTVINRYSISTSKVAPEKIKLSYKNAHQIDKNASLFFLAYRKDNPAPLTDANLICIDEKNNISTLLDAKESKLTKQDVFSSGKNFYTSNTLTYFSPNYSTDIFLLKNKKADLIYHINVGEFALPQKREKDQDIKKYVKTNPCIFGINNIYEVNGNLSFQTVSSKGFKNFTYNKATNVLVNLDNLKYGEKLTHFLPTGTNLIASDSTCFISHLPAAYLLKSYQQIARAEKLPPFTAQSRSLFESIRSRDNPVLVKLYPKKLIFPKNFFAKGI